ncbi:MAG: hypothetical protein LCH34_03535 [Firmicutes bacterium]|nr:hypothetical protein [Bacillota bacterium]
MISIELVLIIPIILVLMMACLVLIQFVTEWASFELDSSEVFLNALLSPPIKETAIQMDDFGIWQTYQYSRQYEWQSRLRNVIDQQVILVSALERKSYSRVWGSFVKHTSDEILNEDVN